MRVAFVSMETTHHRETNGTRRVERVARHLADRGHDVTIFCAQWWDGYEETITRDHVDYRAVTVSPTVPSFVTRLPVLLALHRPDVIHARPDPPAGVVAASLGGTLGRAPLVAERYGDEPIEDDRFYERVATAPDALVTPSETVRTEMRELGAPDERSHVIPESIDMSLVRNVDPAEEIDVVYAHPLDGTGNAESLLLGLAELRDRDWSATIIGDGPERDSHEGQAADLRIDDRVTFTGECDRERRVALYKGAHAFVQTARRACFATEFLRSLACGCVGIVEYQAESSAHELVREHGRSFRVTDPQSIADAIVDAGEFDRMAVDEGWQEFDHDAVLERYLDVYRDLADVWGLL
jgi:glycosyltransferase involved in cell wall biosynthesis